MLLKYSQGENLYQDPAHIHAERVMRARDVQLKKGMQKEPDVQYMVAVLEDVDPPVLNAILTQTNPDMVTLLASYIHIEDIIIVLGKFCSQYFERIAAPCQQIQSFFVSSKEEALTFANTIFTKTKPLLSSMIWFPGEIFQGGPLLLRQATDRLYGVLQDKIRDMTPEERINIFKKSLLRGTAMSEDMFSSEKEKEKERNLLSYHRVLGSEIFLRVCWSQNEHDPDLREEFVRLFATKIKVLETLNRVTRKKYQQEMYACGVDTALWIENAKPRTKPEEYYTRRAFKRHA
jgi:hypothetical protein